MGEENYFDTYSPTQEDFVHYYDLQYTIFAHHIMDVAEREFGDDWEAYSGNAGDDELMRLLYAYADAYHAHGSQYAEEFLIRKIRGDLRLPCYRTYEVKITFFDEVGKAAKVQSETFQSLEDAWKFFDENSPRSQWIRAYHVDHLRISPIGATLREVSENAYGVVSPLDSLLSSKSIWRSERYDICDYMREDDEGEHYANKPVYLDFRRGSFNENGSCLPVVKTHNGQIENLDDIAAYMSDELRDEIHLEMAPCQPQAFYEEYCRRHEAMFNEEFIVN